MIYNDLFSILTYKWFGPAKKILFCAFCKIFATFLQFFCKFFAICFNSLQIFFSIFLHIFQKKKRNRGHESIIQQPLLETRILTWKWVPFVLIPNQFAKNLQKICKKIGQNLQKFCKKLLQKNLQNCRFFAEFSHLHILQKILLFRPREESVSSRHGGSRLVFSEEVKPQPLLMSL